MAFVAGIAVIYILSYWISLRILPHDPKPRAAWRLFFDEEYSKAAEAAKKAKNQGATWADRVSIVQNALEPYQFTKRRFAHDGLRILIMILVATLLLAVWLIVNTHSRNS